MLTRRSSRPRPLKIRGPEQLRDLVRSALSSLRPPPKLNVNQWAEQRRRVAVGTSAEPGRWKSRPYQRTVLEAITDRRAEGVIYIAASQGGGKTEILLSTVGFFVDADPSPQLLVEPSLEMAEALSKDRLAPMIRDTESLRDKVKDPRTRDSDNTIRHKVYPGGHLTLVGANSASGLSMRPVRVLLLDEVDRYPPSAGTEGDPITLAEARTSAYWNAVKVACTSPGYEGGRSWRMWMQSDRQEFFVPCPDCEAWQFFRWEQVQWEKDPEGNHLPKTAAYVCEKCGSCWDDVQRWAAIRRGEYRPTAEFTGWFGFRLPGMAVLGRSLAPMAKKWLEVQGNPNETKAFINTVRAEWYAEEFKGAPGDLLRRVEPYPRRGDEIAIPSRVALLVVGVDTQDNRLELSIYGYGLGFESWLIHHRVLVGDPAAGFVWDDLDKLLQRPWPREDGGYDFIRGACIDTAGHHTQAAYDFCGPRYRRHTADGGQQFVFATIGRSGPGDVWPRAPSFRNPKVPLWTVRVDAAKEQIYGRLGIVNPGPGYVHFPDTLTRIFFDGLTSEQLVDVTDRKNFTRRVWKKRTAGARNEHLDCAVLAYAALCGLRAMGCDLEAEVEALQSRAGFVPPDETSTDAPDDPPEPVRREENSWLGDTRGWLGR